MLNRYSYVRNNPLNFVDPSGYKKKKHHFFSALFAAAAAVIVSFLVPEAAPILVKIAAPVMASAIGAAAGAQVDRAIANSASASTSVAESNSPRGPPTSSSTASQPASTQGGNRTSLISQAGDAVLTPIYNTLASPGSNYGEYLADLDAGRGVLNPHLYGAMLDSLLVISSVAYVFQQTVIYGPQRDPFIRYLGPESDPAGTWVTRSSSGYGTDYAKAMDRLSSPIQWNQVKEAAVPWDQYVAGPRPAAPLWNRELGRFTRGFGAEYRVGGFRNWGRYLSDWAKYLTKLTFNAGE